MSESSRVFRQTDLISKSARISLRRCQNLFVFVLIAVCLTPSVVWSRDFSVPESSGRYVRGRIMGPGTLVYASPATTAKPIGKLRVNDTVSMGQTRGAWQEVKLRVADARILVGWMPVAHVVSLGEAPSKTTPPPVTASSTDPSPIAKASELRVGWTPLFDLHRYGTSQQGALLEYSYTFHPNWAWALPLTYATGGSFQTTSLGAGIRAQWALHPRWKLYVQPEVAAEYLFGQGKSVIAANGAARLGIHAQFGARFSMGLEPFSPVVMVWNNQEIPWNIRSRSFLYAAYSF